MPVRQSPQAIGIPRARRGVTFAACSVLAALIAAAGHAPPTATAQSRPDTAWSAEVRTSRARATALRLEGEEGRTRVRLDVSQAVAANIFTLADPYRAVIDVPDLEFQFPARSEHQVQGQVKAMVTAYRYGQFEAGRSRIVIDLAVPVRIENARFSPPAGKESGRLTFELVRISGEQFAALAGDAPPPRPAAEAVPPVTRAPPQLRSGHFETPGKAPAANARRRPLIVIDPGHGGVDPGAVAGDSLTEKGVVLAVALQLEAILKQGRRYDVELTRRGDTFVSLDQRLAISQRLQADLFISLHADALAERNLASSVSGASVYTLSDRASNEDARRLAEKENRADLLAGLATVPASAEDHVRGILLDLVQRETANFSSEVRNLLVAGLRGAVPLAKDPERSAAFKVLRQSETPAVLIELGYMSNAEDLARLRRPEWQKQVASAIAGSIDTYFALRSARSGR